MDTYRFFLPLIVWFFSSLIFTLLVVFRGGESVVAPISICLVFIAVLYGAYRRIQWLRWIGMVLFFLFAVLCLVAGLDWGAYALFLTSAGYLYLTYILFTLAGAKVESATRHIGLPPQTFYVSNEEYRYPLLLKRVIALSIDGFLMLLAMVLIMYLSEESEWSTIIRVGSGVVMVMMYEPLLTAYDATLGQRMLGIRVRDERNPLGRISVAQAYVRFVVKGLLGWLSFITIHFNPKHQALHDLISSSVMIEFESHEMATG